MAKDPAFLFYYQDFLVGTQFMSHAEKGAYISILCHLADKGPLPESHIKIICGDVGLTENIRGKLTQQNDGNFHQKRLSYEVLKRKNYSKSRRNNRLKKKDMKNICKSYVRHMENENENISFNLLKEKKEKSTDMNTFQKYFYDKYKEIHGQEYIANFGKDGKIFKDLANTIEEKELYFLIDKFLTSNDDFIMQSGFTVGVLKSQINKLRTKQREKYDPKKFIITEAK